jgi:predicted outer membrane repeat protein
MRRTTAALLALACVAHRAAAARDVGLRGARRTQLQASQPSADFHADSFLFAGSIDPQFSCLVLTDLDDGGSDTLRTAVGDPRCARIAIAAGLTIALASPLTITRSLRLECDYAAAVVAPLVPPAPRGSVWDSLGGAAPRAAIGAAGVAEDNATLAGALPGACALDGAGVSRLITVPRSSPAGLRVNITNILLRNGFADGSGPQDGGGAIFLAAPRSLMLLDHVSFANNSASNGGAVLLANTSTLVALACRFSDNVRALSAQHALLRLCPGVLTSCIAACDGRGRVHCGIQRGAGADALLGGAQRERRWRRRGCAAGHKPAGSVRRLC